MTTVSKAIFVIAVPNLQTSATFYRDVLGFSIEKIGNPGWLLYMSGACTIMVGECPDAILPAELGDHSYFAYLQVDDIQSYYESVGAAGAVIRKPLCDEPWGMREFGIETADEAPDNVWRAFVRL